MPSLGSLEAASEPCVSGRVDRSASHCFTPASSYTYAARKKHHINMGTKSPAVGIDMQASDKHQDLHVDDAHRPEDHPEEHT